MTQLPPSRMGELGGSGFLLNLLYFIPSLRQPWFPEKGAGRRRGRVGWPWALGPSAPAVGSAAGFPGKQTCWGLCTRQAPGHDSQQPPDAPPPGTRPCWLLAPMWPAPQSQLCSGGPSFPRWLSRRRKRKAICPGPRGQEASHDSSLMASS